MAEIVQTKLFSAYAVVAPTRTYGIRIVPSYRDATHMQKNAFVNLHIPVPCECCPADTIPKGSLRLMVSVPVNDGLILNVESDPFMAEEVRFVVSYFVGMMKAVFPKLENRFHWSETDPDAHAGQLETETYARLIAQCLRFELVPVMTSEDFSGLDKFKEMVAGENELV